MRVTHDMMSNSMILNLRRQNELLFQVQTKIATQKRLNKPSDNPAGMSRVLEYRSKLSVLEQYKNNINQAKTLIETNEITLDLIDEFIGVTRELAQEYSDPSLSTDARKLAADQIRDFYDQIIQLANSKLGNNYVFSGHQTDIPPFGHFVEISGSGPGDIIFGLTADATDATIEIRDQDDNVVRTIILGDGSTPGSGGIDGINTVAWDGLDDGGVPLGDGHYTFTVTASNGSSSVQEYVTYHGDAGETRIILGENVELSIDADGRNFFSPAGGIDLFRVLKELVNALENPDAEAGRQQIFALMDPLDETRLQINDKRSEYGPTLYRLEHSENHWANLGSKIEMAIGKIEDADIAEAAIELQNLELAYETTLAAAARMIRPGLMDFLR